MSQAQLRLKVAQDKLERFYLQNGQSAYSALQAFGLGISNQDLALIPIGIEDRGDLELSSDGSRPQAVGLRFMNVDIPKGAKITKAYLEFTADESDSKKTNLTLSGEAKANSNRFSSKRRNISSRPKTQAKVNWNNVPRWKKKGKYQTPDLKDIIQEIVNQQGWQANNALSIIVTGSGERTAESYEGGKSKATRLVVEFE